MKGKISSISIQEQGYVFERRDSRSQHGPHYEDGHVHPKETGQGLHQGVQTIRLPLLAQGTYPPRRTGKTPRRSRQVKKSLFLLREQFKQPQIGKAQN